MLRDFSVLFAIIFIIGLAIYLMRFPVERGLTFRGEVPLVPRYKSPSNLKQPKTHKVGRPFRSFK